MAEPFPQPSLQSGVYYQDPWAALAWLETSFGFERTMVLADKDGRLAHAELRFGEGLVSIGHEWSEFVASPKSIGGKNTQTIHVHLNTDIDGHCARARQSGAEILQEPEDQFYGDRTYRARDPEGHVWTFAQRTRQVSREEAERITGLKIDGWH